MPRQFFRIISRKPEYVKFVFNDKSNLFISRVVIG